MDILKDSFVKHRWSSFDKKTLGNHLIGSPALQDNDFQWLQII